MTRRLLFLTVAAALVATSCSSLAVAAATVNGQKITEAEVESELNTLRDDPIFGDALRRDPDARGQRRREILTELIRQQVAEQEARKLRINISRSQVDRVIEQAAAGRGVTVAQFLDQQNLSRDDARRVAARIVRRFELIERVVTDAGVDDGAVREVYEGQQERFEEVHLERITVRSEDAARAVLTEVGAGASFAEVASERSVDGLADRGGDMGYVPLLELDVEVQGAVSRAVEGGMTDPIAGADGTTFEIYRVVDRRTKTFDDVSAEIRSALTRQASDERFEGWLAERVREAEIVVNPKYGRFDSRREQPAVVPATADLRP